MTWPHDDGGLTPRAVAEAEEIVRRLRAMGYVVVPPEPTKAMLDAAHEAALQQMRRVTGIAEGDPLDFIDRREFDVHFVLTWRAAIDAAAK